MPSDCCQVVVLFLSSCYYLNVVYKYQLPIFILLKYLVDDICIYLLLVNFFYRQVYHLSGCQRGVLFITLFENALIISLSLFFSIIIVNKLEADVLPTKSQLHFV